MRKSYSPKWIVRITIIGAALVSAGVLLTVTGTGVQYENIYTDYQKMYSHFAPEGKHSDTESYKYDTTLSFQQNLDKRHANCNDCHDPHSATRASSPLGSYFGAGTQANVSGVKPQYWNSSGGIVVAAGAAPKYSFISSVVKEYELCFKCHSSYAFDFAGYKVAYGRDMSFNWTRRRYWQPGDSAADIIVPETDIAMEFNPNNASFHPVVAHGKTAGNLVLKWAENRTFNETFTTGLSADSRIKCTDCHASDSTNVKGPHGSVNKYILRKRAPTEEPTITRNGYNVGAIRFGTNRKQPYNMTWYVRSNDLLCYICHDLKYYGPGKGHPSRGKHASNCTWHRPIALDEVGCASCKVTPIHGSATNRYMMITKSAGNNVNDKNWCYNCHNLMPGQPSSPSLYEGYPSCPRFYSVEDDGTVVEETRTHFQASRLKTPGEYDVPLPTPDFPTLKGIGNIAAWRYYDREDDYTLFKKGTPPIDTLTNTYRITYDQPSSGDRPDGEPVGEVGYEDAVSLWTIDHDTDSEIYVDVDGNVIAVNDAMKVAPKKATDNLGNDITDVVARRTASMDDRGGWFTGAVGYGNTIDEIYAAGNSFVLDFGDLSKKKTIKLLWGVDEVKGAKLPVLVQTKDEQGNWVTRGSARHSEDRYGYLDLTGLFVKGTKNYQVKVIPTLNFIDYMAVACDTAPVRVTKLDLKQAIYTKYRGETSDMTDVMRAKDGVYATFDYGDSSTLVFDIPQKNNSLVKRDFLFAPTGYYETGGEIHPLAALDPMTADKAQAFGRLTPAGGYANHYNVELIDPGEWNERWQDRFYKE